MTKAIKEKLFLAGVGIMTVFQLGRDARGTKGIFFPLNRWGDAGRTLTQPLFQPTPVIQASEVLGIKTLESDVNLFPRGDRPILTVRDLR